MPGIFRCRRREQDASDRDRQRYKNQLDVTGNEKGQLERLRLQLNEQVSQRRSLVPAIGRAGYVHQV